MNKGQLYTVSAFLILPLRTFKIRSLIYSVQYVTVSLGLIILTKGLSLVPTSYNCT